MTHENISTISQYETIPALQVRIAAEEMVSLAYADDVSPEHKEMIHADTVVTLARIGLHDQAVEHLHHIQDAYSLGRAMVALRLRHDAAADYCSSVIGRDPSPNRRFGMLLFDAEINNDQQSLSRAEALLPDRSESAVALAKAYAKTDRWDDALRITKEIDTYLSTAYAMASLVDIAFLKQSLGIDVPVKVGRLQRHARRHFEDRRYSAMPQSYAVIEENTRMLLVLYEPNQKKAQALIAAVPTVSAATRQTSESPIYVENQMLRYLLGGSTIAHAHMQENPANYTRDSILLGIVQGALRIGAVHEFTEAYASIAHAHAKAKALGLYIDKLVAQHPYERGLTAAVTGDEQIGAFALGQLEVGVHPEEALGAYTQLARVASYIASTTLRNTVIQVISDTARPELFGDHAALTALESTLQAAKKSDTAK